MFSTNVAANEMGFPGKYFFLTNRFNQPNKIGISIAWFWYWFGMSLMVYGLGKPISTIFQSTVYSLNRYIVRYLYTYSIPEGKKWKTWSIVLKSLFLIIVFLQTNAKCKQMALFIRSVSKKAWSLRLPPFKFKLLLRVYYSLAYGISKPYFL